jgi:hypothetical protein
MLALVLVSLGYGPFWRRILAGAIYASGGYRTLNVFKYKLIVVT